MNLRVPPKLPETGKWKYLCSWLNRLREAVLAGQLQVPAGVKRTQTHQGVLLEGNLGGESGGAASDELVWL